jgi:hypothetical protein
MYFLLGLLAEPALLNILLLQAVEVVAVTEVEAVEPAVC